MFRAFPLSGNRAVDLLSVLSQADQRRALRYARVRSKDTRGDCAWGCREGRLGFFIPPALTLAGGINGLRYFRSFYKSPQPSAAPLW